jgi:GWxTD domain-containing protein
MNKHIIYILLLLLFSANIFAGNLKAYFTYCTFSSPESGPYIETYLSVEGNSAIYKRKENNTFQSKIEITLVFKQGEEIKKFKKYNLLSPEINDSLAARVNFMDQQRISLPNGNYEFEITIKDLNSTKSPFKSTQILAIAYPKNEITISDIELIESLTKVSEKSILTKSGYDIIPFTSDFYPESFDKIAFYTEIYNTDKVLGKKESFLISYYIETFENANIAGSYKGFERESAKPVNILLKSFTIDKLPSGNYNLVIEARNKNNDLLTQKKIFFQRSNPKSTPLLVSNDYLNSFVSKIETKNLAEYIECIEPISTHVEINFAQNQLKSKDEELMRQYFYNFWITRNDIEPETAWNNYLKKVKTVNKLFSNQIKKGYKSDRGVVYLKHGPPNTRTEFSNQESTYPHEIWHYYKIGNFNNKKFVFHDSSVGMNDYSILHSDMPGYLNNPQWKLQLHNKSFRPANMNSESNGGMHEDRTNDYYNNPR